MNASRRASTNRPRPHDGSAPLAGYCSCGAESRVRVLAGYRHGNPRFFDLCRDCSRQTLVTTADSTADSTRAAVMLAVSGLCVGLLGVAGDFLFRGTSTGFGVEQQAGVAAGVVLFTLGAILRIDILAIVGLVLFGASAGADMLGVQISLGWGWKQSAAIKLAIVLIGAGVLLYGLHRLTRRKPAMDTELGPVQQSSVAP